MCCYYFPVVLLKRSAIIPCFCQKIDVTIPLFCQKRGAIFFAVLSKGYAIILFFLQKLLTLLWLKSTVFSPRSEFSYLCSWKLLQISPKYLCNLGGISKHNSYFQIILCTYLQCSLVPVSLINRAISEASYFFMTSKKWSSCKWSKKPAAGPNLLLTQVDVPQHNG